MYIAIAIHVLELLRVAIMAVLAAHIHSIIQLSKDLEGIHHCKNVVYYMALQSVNHTVIILCSVILQALVNNTFTWKSSCVIANNT